MRGLTKKRYSPRYATQAKQGRIRDVDLWRIGTRTLAKAGSVRKEAHPSVPEASTRTLKEPMNRRRCEHTTYPVEVLPLDGGKKKIAYCLGCARTAPVCKSWREAVIALREIPRLAFQQRRRSLR